MQCARVAILGLAFGCGSGNPPPGGGPAFAMTGVELASFEYQQLVINAVSWAARRGE
jgi:hypothetical protein